MEKEVAPFPRGAGLLVERLDVHLGQPLGRTHDARRVHRLVGRDQDEAFGAAGQGGVGDRLGAEEVVGHRVRGVVLHQRHVLVRRRVEDGVGPEARQQASGLLGVDHVVEEGLALDVREAGAELAVDLEQRVLGSLHEEDLRRVERGADADDLRADGSAGAGHEDLLAGDGPGDDAPVDAIGRAPDQRADVDADGAGRDGRGGALELFVKGCDEADRQARGLQSRGDPRRPVRHRRGQADQRRADLVGRALAASNQPQIPDEPEDRKGRDRAVVGLLKQHAPDRRWRLGQQAHLIGEQTHGLGRPHQQGRGVGAGLARCVGERRLGVGVLGHPPLIGPRTGVLLRLGPVRVL
jgi:hypothetical protein